ncbi:MAG: helix-turn-helix domain-containing protein [Candidatus Woesebacteria bacterium]|nr:helix-turn-helix domain-containing protein [Candidatus Woesebacteria bacterium]
MDDEYLTLEEVSKKLKVNKATVYRMAKKGKLPAFKFGKVWRVSEKKLLEMIEGN